MSGRFREQVIVKDLEAQSNSVISDLLINELETKTRHDFIKRVYALLSINLAITFGIVALFSFCNAATNWLIEHYWVSIIFSICSLILIIVISCCPHIARNHYVGLSFLFLLSVFFGISVSGLAVSVNKFSVLLSSGITILIFIVLTFFAMQVKYDFTGWGPYLLIGILILVIYSLVLIFIPFNSTAYIIMSALGVLIFSFYVIYDTQRIIGGKHRKYQFSIDDYIFATVSLYLDIINIFTYIIAIFSALEN